MVKEKKKNYCGHAGSGNQYAQLAGASLPTGILVIGIFIMITSLFGFYGAWTENHRLLLVYAIIITILLICQLGIGIGLYAEINQMSSLLTTAWDALQSTDRSALQQALGCCGLNRYNLTCWNANISPCITSSLSGRAEIPCPAASIPQEQTCMPLMLQSLQGAYETVGIVALVFAFLQAVGLGFSFCLIRGIKLAREQDQEAERETPAEIQIREINAAGTIGKV